MTTVTKEVLFSGVLKWIGFGGVITLLMLSAWGGKMSYKISATAVLTEQHEKDLQTLKTDERVRNTTLESVKENMQTLTRQLIAFDSRLAKMERNVIRLCVAARAKCED